MRVGATGRSRAPILAPSITPMMDGTTMSGSTAPPFRDTEAVDGSTPESSDRDAPAERGLDQPRGKGKSHQRADDGSDRSNHRGRQSELQARKAVAHEARTRRERAG